MSVNKVILLGNVGKDPEVRYLDSGIAVATLSLATTDRAYTLSNGTQVPERTEWHNLVLWRGLAETAEKYVHKGDKLYIEGKIKTRSYDDQTGAKRYVTEIFVDNMEMLTPKGAHATTAQPNPMGGSSTPSSITSSTPSSTGYSTPPSAAPAQGQSAGMTSDPTDDLPF